MDRALAGAVLTRDLVVGSERWSKGRRLSEDDLVALEHEPAIGRGPWAERSDGAPAPLDVTLLVPDAAEVHEDEAGVRLAAAIVGAGVSLRGPSESRIDVLAAHDGVLRIDVTGVELLDRIDPVSLFTAYDGQVVSEGAVVASVKVGPHLVPESVLERAEAVLRRRPRSLVDVRPFGRRRVAALVRETLGAAARERFESSVRTRVERLGSKLIEISYVPDDPAEVAARMRRLTAGSPAVDILLTAGAGSTDPHDPVFVALDELGGRVVSHGVPAHPGSMLWLGKLHRTAIIGLPTCGAYSKATAVDLLLPWLLAGDPPTRSTVARLGYGGLLTRDMRFRMPSYARELEAPDG
ncbi:MAG: hypothetical protein QOH61_2266 [Chloroflexota bacterium]|nr:hypothetical protein [Chloroflexota bacterium]